MAAKGAGAGVGMGKGEEAASDFERQRLMNIQRNHQLLMTLGVAPLRECVCGWEGGCVFMGGRVMNVLCVCVCVCAYECVCVCVCVC